MGPPGKSKWKKFLDLNRYSIGIELVNKGHKFGYQNYSKSQIKSLLKLCKNLKKKYSIKKENFLGHSDIAPLRKIDPGEKFPWKKLSKYNFGIWYRETKQLMNFTKINTSSNFSDNEILPSVSNCKFSLSDNIEVAKKSLFSSKGFNESIVFESFSILSCEQASNAA